MFSCLLNNGMPSSILKGFTPYEILDKKFIYFSMINFCIRVFILCYQSAKHGKVQARRDSLSYDGVFLY